MHDVVLLPGIVLPADLAYGSLIEALGDYVRPHAKDLEVYAADEPPPDHGLDTEIDAVLRDADAVGFERFHIIGYSGGGAIATALAAREPDRLLSLALLEPAWLGNEGLSDEERRVLIEFGRILELPRDERMPRFTRLQLATGVELPAPPSEPPPPWMAQRPDGIEAITRAFERHEIDPERLRSFEPPVYFALGELSNPDYFGRMAERAGNLFGDFTLEVWKGRHHFDPPHRVEPERLASRLEAIWDRTGT